MVHKKIFINPRLIRRGASDWKYKATCQWRVKGDIALRKYDLFKILHHISIKNEWNVNVKKNIKENKV